MYIYVYVCTYVCRYPYVVSRYRTSNGYAHVEVHYCGWHWDGRVLPAYRQSYRRNQVDYEPVLCKNDLLAVCRMWLVERDPFRTSFVTMLRREVVAGWRVGIGLPRGPRALCVSTA